MAKSKHEKELARAKKKKDLRRRQNDTYVDMANLDRLIGDLLVHGPSSSGKSIAHMINLKGKSRRNLQSQSALREINQKLEGESRLYVNALAAVGESLWSSDERGTTPAIGTLIYQYPEEEGFATIEVEPESLFLQTFKKFDPELLAEALDYRFDAELVIWLTGLIGTKYHIAFCRDRNGTEVTFVVDGETWTPINHPDNARLFLDVDTQVLRRFDDIEEMTKSAPLNEALACVAKLSGLNDQIEQASGIGREVDSEQIDDFVLKADAVIKASTNELHRDFCLFAVRQYSMRKVLQKTVPAAVDLSVNAPAVPRGEGRPLGPQNKSETPSAAAPLPVPKAAPVQPTVKPLRERLAAVLMAA